MLTRPQAGEGFNHNVTHNTTVFYYIKRMRQPSTDKQPELPLFEPPPTSQVMQVNALGPLKQAPKLGIAGGGNSKLPFYQQPELPLFNAPPAPTPAPEVQQPEIGDVNDKGEVFNGITWCRDESNDPKLAYWQE
jgi:hypothetical protein